MVSLVLLGGCTAGPSVVETEDLPDCAEPADGPAFADLLPDSGVDFAHERLPLAPDSLDPAAAAWLDTLGGAVVLADLDQDGFDDLFLGQGAGASPVYWGAGDGTFTPSDAFLDPTPSGVTSASAADFDGDGRLDLAVGAVDRVALYRHRAGRRFEEVSDDVGIRQVDGIVTGLSWGDPDQDGDLDLFVGRYARGGDAFAGGLRSAPSHLWRNDVGSFSDQTAGLAYPGGDPGAVTLARWTDLDGDSDVDLVQANDFGALHVNSFLHENRGGLSFWDRLPDSGLPLLEAPRGAAVRDLDGDGLPDLWFGGFGSHAAYASAGDFTFTDASFDWPAGVPTDLDRASWSVLDVDVDGDGIPGLFVTYGAPSDHPTEPQVVPRADAPDLFLAPNDGAWTPGPDVPDAQADRRGVARGDLTGDGVPDLVVGAIGGPPGLLAGRCTANQRLVVRLRDRATYNRFAVGASVTVTAGDRSQVQEVVAGGRGSFSGGSPDLFFGLGGTESVDEVRVRWPDGLEEVLGPVCAGCVLTVDRRPAGE